MSPIAASIRLAGSPAHPTTPSKLWEPALNQRTANYISLQDFAAKHDLVQVDSYGAARVFARKPHADKAQADFRASIKKLEESDQGRELTKVLRTSPQPLMLFLDYDGYDILPGRDNNYFDPMRERDYIREEGQSLVSHSSRHTRNFNLITWQPRKALQAEQTNEAGKKSTTCTPAFIIFGHEIGHLKGYFGDLANKLYSPIGHEQTIVKEVERPLSQAYKLPSRKNYFAPSSLVDVKGPLDTSCPR